MGALDFVGQRHYHAQTTTTVKLKTFVVFMERLIPQIAKPVPTFIVLDNPRIHHRLDDSIMHRIMKEIKNFLLQPVFLQP